jgi:hypothetical protein
MKRWMMVLAILLFAGSAWAQTYTVTPTDVRNSYATGQSWVWVDGSDYSAYANSYEVRVCDSSAVCAWGIVGAVGGGETLGSELMTNGDCELDAVWFNYNTPATNERSSEQAHGGSYSRKFIADSAYDGAQNDSGNVTTVGKLYRRDAWLFGDGGDYTIDLYVGDGTARFVLGSVSTGWSLYTQYIAAKGLQSKFAVFTWTGNTTGTLYLDDASLKQVLTPPATAVNVTWGVDEGIDYADVTTVTFFPNHPPTADAGASYTGLTPADNRSDYTATGWAAFDGVDLSPYATGYEIRMCDSAGDCIRGIPTGSVGAGETTGSELLSGWTNGAAGPTYETFTSSGADITSAINTSITHAWGEAYSNQFSQSSALYRLGFSVVINTGVIDRMYVANSVGGGSPTVIFIGGTDVTATGDYEFYSFEDSAGASRSLYVANPSPCNWEMSSPSLKQVLTPPTTGIYVTWLEGAPDYNDIVTITVSPLVPPIADVGSNYTGLTGSNSRFDFTTNGFAWHTDQDLSSHADSGDEIWACDGTYCARGIIGAVGGGEALGASTLTNGDMELNANWVAYGVPTSQAQSAEQKHGGTYSWKVVSAGGWVGTRHTAAGDTTKGLYKDSVWIYSADGEDVDIILLSGRCPVDITTTASQWIYTSCYHTGRGFESNFIAQSSGSATTFYVDDAAVEPVTEPPATAVHVTWKEVPSGLDYNGITQIIVIPTATASGITASGVVLQ